MSIRQAFLQTAIWLLLIVFGLYIAFKVTWTLTDSKYLAIFSWFFVGFGSLLLGVALTRIIFFNSPDFSIWTLSDKQKYAELKKQIGSRISLISISYLLLFFGIIAFSIFSYLKFTKEYRQRQLKLYSQANKVKITNIHIWQGSGRVVEFNYEVNNKPYTNRLPSNTLQIGDSVTVYVSTDNPDIVGWTTNE